jgi:hypothetical protein
LQVQEACHSSRKAKRLTYRHHRWGFRDPDNLPIEIYER